MRKSTAILFLWILALMVQQSGTALRAQSEKKEAPPEPKFKVGDTVTLTVVRAGKTISVKATLGNAPVS